MPSLISVTGQHIDNIVKIDDVDKANIIMITGQEPPDPIAQRWFIGSRLGYVFTTSASNASTGWNQGRGFGGGGSSARGGYVADIGNGDIETIGYGYVDPAADPKVKRWIFGCNLANGASGSTPFINSQSCQPADLDGAGRPSYGTESNYVSASGDGANHGYEAAHPGIFYGNGVWIRGGKWKAGPGAGEYMVVGRSTNGGTTFTMVDMGNTIQDYCRAVCHEGGDSNNWLAVVQSHVWKSTDNGANWTDLGALKGTTDWYSIAYDGAGRWVIVGASGDGFTSTTPVADMEAGETEDQWIDLTSTLDSAASLWEVIYVKGTVNAWVVCGDSGYLRTYAWTSSNTDPGNKWSNITPSGFSHDLYAMATDHHTIITGGHSGRILVWTGGDLSEDDDWNELDRDDHGIGTERIQAIQCDIIGAGKSNKKYQQ